MAKRLRPASTMRITQSIFVSVIIAIMIFLALVTLAPDNIAFSPNNYGWNGMQQVDSTYSIHYINSISQLEVQQHQVEKSLLLIIQPVTNFSSVESLKIGQFAKSGGRVVIADNYGIANQLLSQIGIGISIEGSAEIHDPVFNWKSESYPEAETTNTSLPLLSNVGSTQLALSAPSPIALSNDSVTVVAFSSPRSLEVQRRGGSPSSARLSIGPFPVAAEATLGNGVVFVIGDSQIFTNSAIGILGNSLLVRALFSNRTVYLDTSHWSPNEIASKKADILAIYLEISSFPLYYFVTMGFCGIALAVYLVPEFIASRIGGKKEKAKENTTLSKDSIEHLRTERLEHGIH